MTRQAPERLGLLSTGPQKFVTRCPAATHPRSKCGGAPADSFRWGGTAVKAAPKTNGRAVRERNRSEARRVTYFRGAVPSLTRSIAFGLVFGFLATTHAAAPKGPDIKDTHDRLDRIYQKLGIKNKPPPEESQPSGCGGDGERRAADGSAASPRSTPAMPRVLGYVLLGLVLLGMLLPLVYALRSGYRPTPGVAQTPVEEERPCTTPGRAPWRVDLRQCRHLVEQGRLPEAFAALHRVTLVTLQQADHLTLEETTTNWEYVRRLSSKPDLRQTLAAVTLAAEQSVLGQSPPDKDHYFLLEREVQGLTGERAA
jgi:hypothetical protein